MNRIVFGLGIASLVGVSAVSIADDSPLVIDLTGKIDPRCELLSVEKESVSFDETDTQVINFSVYCNLEMSMRLESTNGGLLNSEAAARLGSLEGLNKLYQAKVAIDKVGFETTMASSELTGGASFPVTGGVVFDATGTLEIKLDNPLDEGYAGTYSDDIKLAVFPSLAGFN